MKKLEILKVSFILRSDKKNSGSSPVMMQLYLSGRRAYIGTGHKVNYDEWDSNFGRVKGSSKKVSTINLHLDTMKMDVLQIFHNMKANQEDITVDEKYGIKVITTSELRRIGAENVSRKVLRYLSDCTDIYVSFDVDSLDSAISKGTGTPVSNGLKEREAEDLISKFMQSRKICCFEITEVNPTLDKENLMAEIAFNILQRSVNVLLVN